MLIPYFEYLRSMTMKNVVLRQEKDILITLYMYISPIKSWNNLIFSNKQWELIIMLFI